MRRGTDATRGSQVRLHGALGDLTAKIVEPLLTWDDDRLRDIFGRWSRARCIRSMSGFFLNNLVEG